jgi:Zn-dependent protease with chaperone function
MAAFLANGGAAFVAGWSVTHGGWQATLLSALPVVAVALAAVLLLACSRARETRAGGTQPTSSNSAATATSILAGAGRPAASTGRPEPGGTRKGYAALSELAAGVHGAATLGD